jgi:hypothetical protein
MPQQITTNGSIANANEENSNPSAEQADDVYVSAQDPQPAERPEELALLAQAQDAYAVDNNIWGCQGMCHELLEDSRTSKRIAIWALLLLARCAGTTGPQRLRIVREADDRIDDLPEGPIKEDFKEEAKSVRNAFYAAEVATPAPETP